MNDRLTSRLEGKKILVTGYTGHLGGAFAEGLAKNNQVTGVTRMATDEEFTRGAVAQTSTRRPRARRPGASLHAPSSLTQEGSPP